MPQNFQPLWDEEATRKLLDQYKGKGHLLPENDKVTLQNHADYHNLPFYPGDFSLFDAVKQAGIGFWEGLTTFSPSDERPDNVYEGIARSVGHLAGFAPGMMAKPLKLLGARGLANRVATWRSAPLFIADKATEAIKKRTTGIGLTGRTEALKTAKNFHLAEKATHITEGAFHLGLASAVSAWQGGIDGMIESGKHGALFGGVFRGLGNLIPGTKAHETAAKAVAGSLFQGLPATMRNATTEEQVYEYLMGAYFGSNEISWSKAKALEFMKVHDKKMRADADYMVISRGDPEFHHKYKDLPEPVKVEAKAIAKERYENPETQLGMAFKLAELVGQEDKVIPDIEGKGNRIEYVDGEAKIILNKKDIPSAKGFNLGGGNKGAEAEFAENADRKGRGTIHYTTRGPDKDIKSKGVVRRLKLSELEDANQAVERANQTLNRDLTKIDDNSLNAIRANKYKVDHGEAVYVVGEIDSSNNANYRKEVVYKTNPDTGKKQKTTVTHYIGNKDKVLKGSSAWVAQMAIDAGKPVYVFDQVKKGWYAWNKNANRFTRIKEPPRPPSRFVGTGTRNLNPVGKKAIERLFDANWGDSPSYHKKVSETAKITPQIEAREQRLENIDLRLDKLEKEMAEIQSESSLAKSTGKSAEEIAEIEAPMKLILKEHDALTVEANQLKNLDVTIGGKERPINNAEDAESSVDEINTRLDNDFDGASDIRIGKKAHQFVKKHLSKLWAGSPTEADEAISSLEMTRRVEDIIESKDKYGVPRFIQRGSKENKSEDLAKAIEADISKPIEEGGLGIKDFTLSPEAKGELRQWVQIQNTGRQVVHLQSDGTKVSRMKDDNNPVSQAGTRKNQREPKKRIEFAFEEAGGEYKLNENGEQINPTYMVLDHVTIRNDKGKRIDMDLSRFRGNYLLKENNYNQELADKAYNKYLSDAMNTMAKDGYYAFGGRADADKIHWVRLHPEVSKLNIKDVIDAGLTVDKNFKKHYEAAKLDFRAKYGRGHKFDDMYKSNVLYDLSMNGMDINPQNIKTIFGEGFIKDSKAFNKRSQIWFSTGYEGDGTFIRSQTVDGKKIVLNQNGNYDYIIVRDLPKSLDNMTKSELKEYQSLIKTVNTHNPEHVDGAIIVRDDILQAISRDFGVIESVGQNKSFIVSPHAEYGALLGKFMFHSAGPKMTEYMKKNGNLHMIMQDSAVKQTGTRKIGDYDITKDGLVVDAERYELAPEHVLGSYGVYGSKHMIERQRLPKQVLGNLVRMLKNPIEQDVIDDMFNEIINKRYEGDPVLNQDVEKYLDLSENGGISPKELRALEVKIESNLDDIGIPVLIKAMKSDHALHLTEAIYNKILKVEKNNAYQDLLDGTMTEEEYNRVNAEINETSNTVNKIVNMANEWVQQQRSMGNDMSASAIYMHKFVRDFRVKAVQNFIINSATKPKMDNSAVGFIRPYDKAMQYNVDNVNELLKKNNVEGINYKDDIFFLDDAHRKIIINTNLVGKGLERIALGRLWDKYNNGEFTGSAKLAVEDIFRAATVRVPMDSVSGVQVLKFGGFTGRKGHGILMHSRAMRAEGGADLDGDKSFIFFGGKGGWKKSWKDAYESNKNEHYSKDGTSVRDNKEATIPGTEISYDDILTADFDKNTKERYDSKAFQFAPGERLRISAAAVDGRNLLGPAVIQKQVMTAAYNSILAGGGEDVLQIEKYHKGKKYFYEVKIKARDSEESQEHQRRLGRAQLGLASDPLDVLGMKSQGEWFNMMWDAHFDIVDAKARKSGSKFWKKLKKENKTNKLVDIDGETLIEEALTSNQLKSGILKDYYNINQAYWGRNWAENRKYSMGEIKDLGASVFNIAENPARMNNVLAKTGNLLQGLDWSDSIFGRINKKQVMDMYALKVKELPTLDWLKTLLGRPTFKTEMGSYIENTLELGLWKEGNVYDSNGKLIGGIEVVAKDTNLFRKAVKGTLFAKDKDLMKQAIRNRDVRKQILRKIKDYAEDFIVNDITDMTTIKNVARIAKEMQDTGDFGHRLARNMEEGIARIHEKVEELKKNSYLMARDRKNLEQYLKPDEKTHSQEALELNKKIIEIWEGIDPKAKDTPKKQKKLVQDDISAEMDQALIDLEIVKFKQNLSENGKQLFEQLMLGSLSRGKMSEIDALISSVDKFDKTTMDLIHSLRMQASQTRTSKLGFNSNEISEQGLKEHLGTYLNHYEQIWTPPTSKEVKSTIDNIHKSLDDPANKEKTGMPDDPLNEFIQESIMDSGYQGLKESKLSREQMSVISEIATILKSWGNGKLNQDLNLITRGNPFIQKDLNTMNYQDFVVFRNYLREVKRGNTIQRWLKKWGGKKHQGATLLGLRHHLQIPETVGRELMVDDLQFMEQNGYFTTRYGGRQEGRILKPTNYIDMMNNWASLLIDKSTGHADGLIKKFHDTMQFHTGLEDAEALWQVAIRQRELGLENSLLHNPDATRRAEQQTIVNKIRGLYNETLKETDYEASLKNKEYLVNIDGKRIKMTGEEIVKRIDKEVGKTLDDMHKFIVGDPGVLEDYIYDYWDKDTRLAPKIDYKKFIRHMTEHMTGGKSPWKGVAPKDVPTFFGIDNLRAIARSMMLDLMPTKTEADRADKLAIAMQPVFGTRKIEEGYFPHMFFDKKIAKEMTDAAMEKIIKTPNSEMDEATKKVELKKLQYRYRSLEGDWNFKDMEEYEMFNEVLQDISEGKRANKAQIRWFNANERAGSMHARTSYTGGWSIDPVVMEAYIRSLTNTYYRQLTQMFGRDIVDRMGKEMPKKWGLEQTTAWQQWMQMYINDAIGNPSIVPEAVYENPAMKLKWSPYAWWADNRVRDKINKVYNKLGLGNKNIPENLRGIDVNTVRYWSNLEAQYEMASLLAHPKSTVMNLFGGTMNTFASAGPGNWIKGKTISYLQKINPAFNSKEAVTQFTIKMGVVPEYLLYELGLQKEWQSTKGKNIIAEMREAMTRDPEMNTESLVEVASRHGKGWKDKAMNFATKFMTLPETALRRDAFMAHYVQAWEKYGGAFKEYDHPFLIEKAKQGVKATQFLYNAPNRPAFARTALGKVFSRFQMYAWNSVKLRNDVKRDARIAGYRPGTPEFERYKRFWMADMFMLGMANVFDYSLFDTNLPQPYGWYKDTAEWIFGDEETRDKAFFGAYPTAIAPLQIVTPPALRLVGPTMNGFINDDWSKMAKYHIWNAFPFGRMGRDLFGEYNIIDNPSRIPEKFFGIPLGDMQRKRTEMNRRWEEEEEKELLELGR